MDDCCRAAFGVVVLLPSRSGVDVGEKALWPMVAVVGIVCAMLGLMAATGLNVVALIAIVGVLFTGVSSLISIILYGKMVKVEHNTNGNASADRALIVDLINTIKQAPAIKD